MTRGWGAGEDVIKDKTLQALVAGSEPESPQTDMTPIYQPSVPKEGRTCFQMPYFPVRVGGERIVSSLVGSLVFFLLAEWGI